MDTPPDDTRPGPPPEWAELAARIKDRWRDGEPPDAAAAVRDHPQLRHYPSLIVDLAYEQFCLAGEAGFPRSPEPLYDAFPEQADRIREQLLFHRLCEEDPEVLTRLLAPPWPAAGDRVGEFVVVRPIGAGSFGRVYLANQPAVGNRTVVLKLAPSLSDEADTLGPIRHPNVTEVLSAGRIGGWWALGMPFVGTATLAHVAAAARAVEPRLRTAETMRRAIAATAVPGVPVPVDERTPSFVGAGPYAAAVAGIFERLADALALLHRSRVFHGDIKPSNVVLGPRGCPYLIDFNLSTGPVRFTPRLAGTLPYMPSERLRTIAGQPADVGTPAQADAYAFGTCLFEVLTGTLPIEVSCTEVPAATARELLRHRSSGALRRAVREAAIPRPLVVLIAECLSEKPALRPDAEALRRRLRAYLDRGRRRARAAALAAAALAVAASAAIVPFERPPPVVVEVEAAAPTTHAGLLARGRQSLAAGDDAAALADFGRALDLQADGPTTARYAYCLTRVGQQRAAVEHYRKAIDGHRYGPAWVHNDLAFSLCRMSQSPECLREAAAAATRALELAPASRAARLNRAAARFGLHFDGRAQALRDPACLADLEAALASGPIDAALAEFAAEVLAASADGPDRETRRARAVLCLRDGIAVGLSPESLANNPIFARHLAARKDYAEALLHVPGRAAPRADPFLVEPTFE